jgi:uncharacterized membrane protein
MKFKALLIFLLAFALAGCIVGTADTVRLKGNVNPAQISLDKRAPVSIEANVENIANLTETVSVDVEDTEGLSIVKPERTTFTLKPGESRVVIFMGTLDEAGVPGEYRIDIYAETKNGDVVNEVVFLNVVAERGFI